MSTLYVDNLQPNLGTGVSIPGHVIQTVYAEDDTAINTTSTSYIDTSVTASITPKSASSKILVIVQSTLRSITSSTNGSGVQAMIHRDGTAIGKVVQAKVRENLSTGNTSNVQGGGSIVALDTPNTTSQVTYTVRVKTANSAVECRYNSDGTGSTITLMEIAQ